MKTERYLGCQVAWAGMSNYGKIIRLVNPIFPKISIKLTNFFFSKKKKIQGSGNQTKANNKLRSIIFISKKKIAEFQVRAVEVCAILSWSYSIQSFSSFGMVFVQGEASYKTRRDC